MGRAASARGRLLQASSALLLLGFLGCGGSSDFGWLLQGDRPGPVGQEGFAVRWRQRLVPPIEGAFVPVERAVAALDPPRNRVYVGSSAGFLYAMTPGGTRIYRYDAGGAIESEPSLDRQRDELYVGTEQAELHALRTSDGELRWRKPAGGPVRKAPLLVEDAVYVVTENDVVTAFARDTGETLWTYRREAPEGFSITDHAGLVMVSGRLVTAFTDGAVVALDPTDGRIVWERETSVDVESEGRSRPRFVDVDTTPLVVGDDIYVASYAGGVYALDGNTGTVEWHDADRTGVIAMTLTEDRILLASADEGVVCLSRDDREQVWRHALQRGAPTQPVVVNDTLIVGESRGSLIALSLLDGHELSRLDAGHGFSARPSFQHGLGFVVSNGGALLALAMQ